MKLRMCLMAAALLVSTPVKASSFMLGCTTSAGEAFVVSITDNKVAIQWADKKYYDANAEFVEPKLYVKQEGKYGTFVMMYDFNANVGLGVTEYKDGQVNTTSIKCASA